MSSAERLLLVVPLTVLALLAVMTGFLVLEARQRSSEASAPDLRLSETRVDRSRAEPRTPKRRGVEPVPADPRAELGDGSVPVERSAARPRVETRIDRRELVPGQRAGDVYPLVFPVRGDTLLTASFGDRRGSGRNHSGEDMMAEKLTPVVAAAAGTIVWLHGETGGNCCDVALEHDDGWRSRYIHLNNDTPGTDDGRGYGIAAGLEVGSRLEAGELVGWVGDSGNAEHTGPHLHFELRRPDGRPVDPFPSLLAAADRARDSGFEIRSLAEVTP